jgi:hypothetical protein
MPDISARQDDAAPKQQPDLQHFERYVAKPGAFLAGIIAWVAKPAARSYVPYSRCRDAAQLAMI